MRRDIFDRYLKAYDKVIVHSDQYQRIVRSHLALLKKCRFILDSGAGSGYVTEKLLKLGKEVIVSEPNKTTVDLLKERCGFAGRCLRIYQVRTENFVSKDRFDGINSLSVLQFTHQPRRVLEKYYQLLKKGGVLALTTRKEAQSKKWTKDFLNSVQRSFIRKGLMRHKEYRDAFRDFQKLRLGAASKYIVYNFEKDELMKMLRQIGFRKVEIVGYPYFRRHITVRAVK